LKEELSLSDTFKIRNHRTAVLKTQLYRMAQKSLDTSGKMLDIEYQVTFTP